MGEGGVEGGGKEGGTELMVICSSPPPWRDLSTLLGLPHYLSAPFSTVSPHLNSGSHVIGYPAWSLSLYGCRSAAVCLYILPSIAKHSMAWHGMARLGVGRFRFRFYLFAFFPCSFCF